MNQITLVEKQIEDLGAGLMLVEKAEENAISDANKQDYVSVETLAKFNTKRRELML